MIDEFYIWRLVAWEKCATLKEIDTHWTVRDVLKANAMVDFKSDIEEEAYGRDDTKRIAH